MTKIQKKRIQKWVDTLEAGTYKKGVGALRKDDTFCCLGVACEIYRKTTKHGKWDQYGDFLGICVDLPNSVADWFGLESADPKIGKNNIIASTLNDGDPGNKLKPLSHKKIAKLIASKYLKD